MAKNDDETQQPQAAPEPMMPGVPPGQMPGMMPGMVPPGMAPMPQANPILAMMQMMQMMQGMMMGGAMGGMTVDPAAMSFAAAPAVALSSVLDLLCLTEDGQHALGGVPKGCTMALTDAFAVTRALEREGALGLCGAYSRNRRDHLELGRGLDATSKMLGAGSLIIDGELCGTLPSAGGMRPATVYELFGSLQGESALPIELTVTEGQTANSKEDVNRLYQHFRSQGYEGIITKALTSPYRLAMRDPGWLKRKPEITLDLVLLGAVLAVTTKEKAGMFGSYVIGARGPEGGVEDTGDVAGVDRVRDAEIQQVIMSEGLLTGRRSERRSASGTRLGFELVPHIVVTVRFEGVIRDSTTGQLSLRDPKLVVIRPDKAAHEADSTPTLQELYLKQKVG